MTDAIIAPLQPDLPFTEKSKEGTSLLSGKPHLEEVGLTKDGLPITSILINTTGRWTDFRATGYGITIFGESEGDEARLDFAALKAPGTLLSAYANQDKDQIEVILVPFRIP